METAPETLAQTLARLLEIDPTLGRVADAWPALPEHARQTILAIIDAATPAQEQPAQATPTPARGKRSDRRGRVECQATGRRE